jgi:hypothetical protein
LEVCCSPLCAIEYARKAKPDRLEAQRKRIRSAEKREGRESLMTRREWLKGAQAAFNAWIRERDYGLPCISCGRNTGSKRNAGHYLSVGSHPELRFEPLNCHSQCEHCNSWQSGNAVEYRRRLIEKIGVFSVEWLEGPHEPKKYTIEELKQLAVIWRGYARQLRARRELAA